MCGLSTATALPLRAGDWALKARHHRSTRKQLHPPRNSKRRGRGERLQQQSVQAKSPPRTKRDGLL